MNRQHCPRRPARHSFALAALALAGLATLSGCGSPSRTGQSTTITLVAYDSFPTKDSPLVDALAEFTASSGITVKILTAGDAGTMVAKAALTAGNPEGDVIWGVDNTLMSAALESSIFDGQPTKVDTGDVCVNYDIAWFTDHHLAPPSSYADLTRPEYRDLLVVEDPISSSPGLAFLLGSIVDQGEPGWQAYWMALRANGVKVVDSWDTAYYEQFSAAGSGTRPLVVSYGTSPPADVVFSDPPRSEPVSAVVEGTCFRQEEYAGVLRGTSHVAAANRLVEFFVSERFQREMPLTLFVNPVNPRVTLPEVFTRFGVRPLAPLSMDPSTIASNRQAWQEQWTSIVLR